MAGHWNGGLYGAGGVDQPMDIKNLFAQIPPDHGQEFFEKLAEGDGFQLERIVSRGQSTPPGEWLEQDRHEWVVLLGGGARLQFQGEAEPVALAPGDYVLIPAHQRHRVEWTAPGQDTVWLALHYDG